MKILVTGGAGFIGSHLARALLERGHAVRIYDNLEPQVHGASATLPASLSKEVEFIHGDMRDRENLSAAMKGIEVIFHEAAAVGVGQSMYQVKKYVEVNCLGAANLLDILTSERGRVERLILASSFSNYGEGKYSCTTCGIRFPKLRSAAQLKGGDWEVPCPSCSSALNAVATDEEKPLVPTSVYAISKRDQEELFCVVGAAYGIPTSVLRYFNVYGPGQALANPYTGIISIFSSALLNGKSPLIFEDGRQTRDFTHVSDVVQANLLAMEKHREGVEIFNVGTGAATDLITVYRTLHRVLKGEKLDEVPVSRRFRAGDIRHCFADLTKTRSRLGYRPSVSLEQGLEGMRGWLQSQAGCPDPERTLRELESKGLVR